MPKTITVKTTEKQFIKKLKKHQGGLANASADTVNTAAKVVEKGYKVELKKFTNRNKFTMNAVKIFKSKPKSSKGDFRPVKDINSVVGVRKMKGGKDHYLLDQEIGGSTRGKTKGKVPIPTDAARGGGSNKKPVKSALRLQNSKIQTLQIGGERGPVKNFGTKGDGFKPRQRWAILYKYTGLSGRGGSRFKNRYGWDLSKQFFFQGLRRGLGVFAAKGRRIKMTRSLDKSSVQIKPLHKFNKAFSKLTPVMMSSIFKRAAGKILR